MNEHVCFFPIQSDEVLSLVKNAEHVEVRDIINKHVLMADFVSRLIFDLYYRERSI